MQLIDGKKIAEKILKDLSAQIQTLPFEPVLIDIFIGRDMVSELYVRIKQKRAEECGLAFELKNYSNNESQDKIYADIEGFCKRPEVCGVILQLPVPKNFDKEALLKRISPEVDADCLTEENLRKFYAGQPILQPPTVKAILKIFEEYKVELAGKKILIVGQGELVGRPLAHVLKSKGFDVTTADRSTKNLHDLFFHSDVVVSAVGQPKLINAKMLKKGAVVIDAGTADSAGGIVGDVDNQSLSEVVGLFAPVPGGVGPVTVAMLIENVFQVAKSRKS